MGIHEVNAQTGKKISQSYLSQIESGMRPNLTQVTRNLLAGFFKVHPGFLVDEEPAQLGTGLKLPPWEEVNRSSIEAMLPPIQVGVGR